MPDILEPYHEVVKELEAVLYNLPGKLIAIDGKDGSGKTTLSRYLSWYFNVSLIESDLFRTQEDGKLEYREDEIKRIIEYRLNLPRPVIIESVVVQQLLKNINKKADFNIYIINETYERDNWLVEIIHKYEKEYNPKNNANKVIELNVI